MIQHVFNQSDTNLKYEYVFNIYIYFRFSLKSFIFMLRKVLLIRCHDLHLVIYILTTRGLIELRTQCTGTGVKVKCIGLLVCLEKKVKNI